MQCKLLNYMIGRRIIELSCIYIFRRLILCLRCTLVLFYLEEVFKFIIKTAIVAFV